MGVTMVRQFQKTCDQGHCLRNCYSSSKTETPYRFPHMPNRRPVATGGRTRGGGFVPGEGRRGAAAEDLRESRGVFGRMGRGGSVGGGGEGGDTRWLWWICIETTNIGMQIANRLTYSKTCPVYSSIHRLLIWLLL